MTKEALLQKLDYVDHTRKKRGEMANLVLSQPYLIPFLLEIAFENQNETSDRAIWVAEYATKQNLRLLIPHIDLFTKNLQNVKREQGIRPIAKMCELVLVSYYSKKETESKKSITKKYLKRIATACFDWLIGNHKVASKAHAMTSLYLLGKDFEWIHPELKMVIEQNYASGSAAYKARARRVLSQLKN